jgi:hypothetical protein
MQLQFMKKFANAIALIVCLLCFFFGTAFSGQDAVVQPVVQGNVDSLVVEGNKIILQGWAGSVEPEKKIVSIAIWLADTLVYDGGFEQLQRKDVVKAKERNEWLKSGWRVSAVLPENHKSGKFSVRVQVRLDSGTSENINVSPRIPKIVIGGNDRFSTEKTWDIRAVLKQLSNDMKWKTRGILIALVFLLFAAYFQADFCAERLTHISGISIKPPFVFGSVLLFAFLVIISLGITGSSVKLGLKSTPFVQSDGINIWGEDKPIRSDEWVVSTPLNIAQYNHQPRFPIVNKNLGEDGQNMLIASGAPVAHISSIAKPMTWGFFLFDLRRALSWYWCFPLFACLFALWGLITLLSSGGDWRSGFLISLWFCVSPYDAAWSNSPASTVLMPSLALLSAIAILKFQSKYLLLILGCVLGVTLAGFVLVLYPPWQVSLAYVFLALAFGVVVRDKLYRNFNSVRLLSFGLAIIIAGFILWRWWSDASHAIQAMSATIYPGQRTTVTGGGYTFSDLLRGFTNIVTLYKISGVHSNQCEIASFLYMLLPLAFLFIVRLYQRSIGLIEIALVVVIGLIMYYMFLGFPVTLANFSLWGRVTPQRADIALGLSYILLCGILLSSMQKPISDKASMKFLAFVVAVIWATMTLSALSHLDPGILVGFSPGVEIGMFFIVIIAGYWLAYGKFHEFITLNLLLSVATIGAFNPINIAPNNISVSPSISNLVDKKSSAVADKRILVLETQIPAMYLLASGLPVVNGVFYFPQRSLWERLDKAHVEIEKYNRYQHLSFLGGSVENTDNFRIETRQLDVVIVVVDLERFDFRKTGASLITAPQKDENELRKNATLSHMRNENGWSWFQITET